MKKFFKRFCVICFSFSVVMFGFISYYNNILPSNIVIYDNESVHFNTKLKISEVNNEKINSVSNAKQTASRNYNTNLSVMGVIPVKSVNIKVVNRRYVALSGENFGIKIFTKGVMVVGMSDVITNTKSVNPAKESGLKLGDIILKINGKDVNSNSELSSIINKSLGKSVALKVKRENKILNLSLVPVLSSDDNIYKAGLWVRDSTAGLGTMTFYSPVDGSFAGLGHGIVDVDTGVLLPINSGEIVKTEILSITKSKVGTAGEICGAFTGLHQGKLTYNCECGLYGYLDDFDTSKKLTLVSHKQDVKTGKAKILTTITNGKPKYYDCVIEKVDYNNDEQKNLQIRITDKELLEKCGGIVQGMSGSPIIQDGCLVGALTNVFVNSPEKGYAVFAETMLETAKNLEQFKEAG